MHRFHAIFVIEKRCRGSNKFQIFSALYRFRSQYNWKNIFTITSKTKARGDQIRGRMQLPAAYSDKAGRHLQYRRDALN